MENGGTQIISDVFTERCPEAVPVLLKERKISGDPNARVYGWFPENNGKLECLFEPDTQLRGFENIPLKEDIAAYFRREIEPHVPEAWADGEKIRSAYEINFNRHFYQYTPPRPLAEIDADIKRMEEEIIRLLHEVTA